MLYDIFVLAVLFYLLWKDEQRDKQEKKRKDEEEHNVSRRIP